MKWIMTMSYGGMWTLIMIMAAINYIKNPISNHLFSTFIFAWLVIILLSIISDKRKIEINKLKVKYDKLKEQYDLHVKLALRR